MFLGIGVALTGLAVHTSSRRHRMQAPRPPVVAWGDSLTAGAGASAAENHYPAAASKLYAPHRTIQNEGIGGQSSTQIAARQGGVPLLVSLAGPVPLKLSAAWDFADGLSGWSSRLAANPPAQIRTEGGELVIEAIGTPQSGAQVWLGHTLPAGTVCTVTFDIKMGGAAWVEAGLVNAVSATHFSGGWSASAGFSSGGRKSFTFTVGSSAEKVANSLLIMAHTQVGTIRVSNVRLETRSAVGVTKKSVNVLTSSGSFAGAVEGRLAGICGTMSTNSAGDWTFTRLAAGPAVSVPDNTPFIPTKSRALRDHTAWIWAGRNNASDPAGVKADIAAMVAHLGHSRFLIAAILPAATEDAETVAAIEALNADLAAQYGRRFVDVLGALKAAGNGSSTDTADVTAGQVPSSLRADAVHLNDAGYAVVAAAMAAADQR